MRILVTGSEGSLMQAVIPKLMANGHEVIGVDKCGPHSDPPGYLFYEKDLVQMTDRWYAGRIDMVIHAAATIYGVGGFNAYCGDILSNDLVMTRNMLRFAALNDVKKFVSLSSSMVYERCPSHSTGVEEAEVDWQSYQVPLTDYGLSKYTGERMVKAFNVQYGLPYVIWRPFNIITPYEHAKGAPGTSHVFADFFDAILKKKMELIPILGSGNQTRCFTWIHDVAQAIADFSEKAEGAYNIGSTEEVTMLELAKLIWVLSGRDPTALRFNFLKPYINDVMRRKPNVDKIAMDFGWTAKTTLTQSIGHCLDYYKGLGYT